MDTKHVPLSEIATIKGLIGGPFGSSLVNNDYMPIGVPVIRGTNLGYGKYLGGEFAYVSNVKVAQDLARNVAIVGDVVFTQRGTLGQVAIVPASAFEQYVISQSQMRLRVNSSVAFSDYVYYACSSALFQKQVADNAISTGVPHINLGILNRLTIPLPAVSEQRAIAEVLGALDDKIAANTKLAEVADEYMSAQFALATRNKTSRNEGIFDAFEIDFGEPFRGMEFSDEGVGRPLIRIRDLKTFRPQIWTTEIRSREVVIMPGDVVVGMDAEFRATSWVGDPGLLNQRVCRVRGNEMGNAFVRESLKQPLASMENQKSATTVIHLNKSDLTRMSIVRPGKAELGRFEFETEPLYRFSVELAQENRTLAATRDALLPQLMSGKLRVRDAEMAVEAVV